MSEEQNLPETEPTETDNLSNIRERAREIRQYLEGLDYEWERGHGRQWGGVKFGHFIIARSITSVGLCIVELMPVCVKLWWEYKERYDRKREAEK